MRLLQIVDSLHAGGMENFRGHVCNELNPAKFAKRLAKGVRLKSLREQPGFRWGAVKQVRQLLDTGRDLIHTHHLGGPILVDDGGDKKQSLLRKIEPSPARHRIHWAGFQQDPLSWYQAMDVLVVASSFEGLPNAVLEGIACGIPVLANDLCGVREVAKEEKHGWIEDLSTVERLIEACIMD